MNTYTIIKNKINNNKIKYQFTKSDNNKLTYKEFINLLKNKDENFLGVFRQELTIIQSELGQSAYFWKCVPVSSNTLNKEFEFVAIKSNELENMTQDYSSFQSYFNRSNKDIVSFPSRSGDTLVSPVPVRGHQYSCTDYDDEIRNYKNLREFNCEAPQGQWNNLWQKVGEKMDEELKSGNNTRWLNTHGLAVPYLHIRLDKSPKYYQGCEEYRVETQQQQEIPPKTSEFPSRGWNKW